VGLVSRLSVGGSVPEAGGHFNHCFELQPSRERPTDDVIAAFLAETNMLSPCRHGDPGTLQCVGCLTRRLRGNIPTPIPPEF